VRASNGRACATTVATVGFGLIFVGISLLQQGMGGFVDIITPKSFPGNTRTGCLLLVLFGIAFALVTQSSCPSFGLSNTTRHVYRLRSQSCAIGL